VSAPGLNWLDPDAVEAWVRDVETSVNDLVEVAEDQTDPPVDRVHGRAGARRIIDDAARSLREQLAHARAGLP
jgi:hypothetical protein